MRRIAAYILYVLAFAATSHAAPSKSVMLRDLPLESDYRRASEPLTTEKAWTIDPNEPNPHRRRWELSRQLDFAGLGAIPSSKAGRYGIRAKGLVAKTRAYVRGPGPWYRPLAAFDCAKSPEPYFATEEGSKLAADYAAQEWRKLVEDEKLGLALLLSHIAAPTPELAIKDAEDILEAWSTTIGRTWRRQVEPKVREHEWALYRAAARSRGLCQGAPPPKPAFRWEAIMEPPAPVDQTPLKVLARAPARRWNGMFSVRLDVKIGTQALVGQFLIDSSAPRSIISPSWLEAQGVLAPWVEVPRAPLERAIFSGGNGGGLARPASVDGVLMSGLPLPITDFLLYETDFFGPPDNVASCCDGVLGTDFLHRFVVQFRPGPPAEVVLWPREGYHPNFVNAPVWVEASLNESSQVVSDCELTTDPPSAAPASAAAEPPALSGMRWDTGAGAAVELHEPWRKWAPARAHPGGLSIRCGDQVLGEHLTAVPAEIANAGPAGARGGAALLMTKHPAFTVGTAFLARDEIVFDLPHGRIWLPERAIPRVPARNLSGAHFYYDFVKGERVLFVGKLDPHTPAQALISAGLRKGMTVASIDGDPAEDLDLWEVERRLSGMHGEAVEVRWPAGKPAHQVEMKLPGTPVPKPSAAAGGAK